MIEYKTMKTLNCIKYFEHIHIIYEGGDVTEL